MAKRKKARGLPKKELEIFISYSHKDKSMKDSLMAHLSPLLKQYNITVWHDGCIRAGDNLDAAILEHLSTANVVLLLVSSFYVSSHYCFEVELEKAIHRHNAGECIVIPVILKETTGLSGLSFGQLLMVPQDGKPINTFNPRDSGYANACKMIETAIKPFFSEKNASTKRHNKVAIADIDSPPSVIPQFKIYSNGKILNIPVEQSFIDHLPLLYEKTCNLIIKIRRYHETELRNYREARRRGSQWWATKVRTYLFEVASYIHRELVATNGVRVHFRKLDGDRYVGVTAITGNGKKDIRQDWSTALTAIPLENSMISASCDCDAPLIKSYNNEHHYHATHDDEWVDYVTCVFKKLDPGLRPILSLGVSVDGSDYAAQKELLLFFAYARIDNIIQRLLIEYSSECQKIDSRFSFKATLNHINNNRGKEK